MYVTDVSNNGRDAANGDHPLFAIGYYIFIIIFMPLFIQPIIKH